MNSELTRSELDELINRQLSSMFGPCEDLRRYLDIALQRSETCFSVNQNKYYHDESGNTCFSPYHSGQYSIFLYYLANSIFQIDNNKKLATKVYYLNKILNAVDWYFEVALPEIWGVEHPLSSILGRAVYGNGFYIYQGCTVGGNKGKYPVIGKNVILYSNVTILGDARIGDNVVFSTGTTVKDEIIPGNCLVFGQSPNLIVKQKDCGYMDKLLSEFWIV
jgi:serine O-acetyltransferase